MGVDDKILAEEGLKASKKITRLTPNIIKSSPQFWELKHELGVRELDSDYISDEDIKFFIIEDLLSLDFWKDEHNKEITFTEDDLLRFIPKRFVEIENKVKRILHSPDVSDLLIFKEDGTIVINNNRMKEAMDIVGIVSDEDYILEEVTKENTNIYF